MILFDLKCTRDHVFEAWFPNSAAYDKQATDLAKRFVENFKKYAEGTSEAIKNAGPVSN